jgi:hypothetical protein
MSWWCCWLPVTGSNQDLFPQCVDYEHEAMAASEGQEAVFGGDQEGEAAFRDAIGSLRGR